MTWAALIAALVAFFEPILQSWLADLLKKIEDKLTGSPTLDPTVAITDVFTAARGQLWFWQFARRKQLDAAQRVAISRAGDLAAAAQKGLKVPVMTTAEYDKIKNGA